MEKIVGLLILSLILLSCRKNSESEVKEFKIQELKFDNKLSEILAKYKSKFCGQGITSIRFHKYCEGEFAEIWCTTGWQDLQDEYPQYYSRIDGNPYFIFSSRFLNTDKSVVSDEIQKIIENDLVNDIGSPPNTGFQQKWLYRTDKEPNIIYSFVDSLFKYDSDILFERNLRAFTGKAFCY